MRSTSKADANKKALPSRASNAQAQNQFLLGFEDATCILNPNSGFMRFWDGVYVYNCSSLRTRPLPTETQYDEQVERGIGQRKSWCRAGNTCVLLPAVQRN